MIANHEYISLVIPQRPLWVAALLALATMIGIIIVETIKRRRGIV